MIQQLSRVSILGCGWLGLPLAEQLIAAGYQVNGSTTTPEKLEQLRQKKIQPFLIRLTEAKSPAYLTEFLTTDSLVVSFPPRLRVGGESNYLPQINLLAEALEQSPIKRVLFISSTSVYQDVNRVVTEQDQSALDMESPLYKAENTLQSSARYYTVVLRLGGLVGGSRHAGRFLAGKMNVPQPNSPVNLLHLNDGVQICARIIATALTQKEVFNVVADQHPSRQEFYTAAAKALKLTPPQFLDSEELHFKVISNQKIKATLSYEFIHPDPMLFF